MNENWKGGRKEGLKIAKKKKESAKHKSKGIPLRKQTKDQITKLSKLSLDLQTITII